MKNCRRAHVIHSPKVFRDIVTLSGLNQSGTILRASPDLIHRMVDSIECLTSSAVCAFESKYPDLSGDIYLTRILDNHNKNVIAGDIIRPDFNRKTKQYVMDQDPFFIFEDSLEPGNETHKVDHLKCEGRTLELSAYNALSSYTDDKRDVPIQYSEISALDPGIMNAIRNGLSVVMDDHNERNGN